jgi:hypothetical protein
MLIINKEFQKGIGRWLVDDYSALMYVCADQQTLFRATDNHMYGSGTRLKATDATNLPMPLNVALEAKGNFHRVLMCC